MPKVPEFTARYMLGVCLMAICESTLLADHPRNEGITTAAGGAIRYMEVLKSAQRGDAGSQNLAAYMLFTGSGVTKDPATALTWFAKSANGGSLEARINLVVIFTVGVPGIEVDRGMAQHWIDRITIDAEQNWKEIFSEKGKAKQGIRPDQVDPVLRINVEFEHDGKGTFLIFCAGCHGFDGFASYPTAPSFSMGERLEKSDKTLVRAILGGKGAMPAWRHILTQQELLRAVHYLRAMAILRKFNTLSRPPPIPDRYLLFPESPGGQFIGDDLDR